MYCFVSVLYYTSRTYKLARLIIINNKLNLYIGIAVQYSTNGKYLQVQNAAFVLTLPETILNIVDVPYVSPILKYHFS